MSKSIYKNLVAFIMVCGAMFLCSGCNRARERPEVNEVLFSRLDVRQEQESQADSTSKSHNWTVAAGEPFFVSGSLMQSGEEKVLEGAACTVKIRSLRGDKFVIEDSRGGRVRTSDGKTGKYDVEVNAPEKPGIYFLSVSYHGQIMTEATVRVQSDAKSPF